MERARYQITWDTPAGRLIAREPYDDEIVRHAPALMAAYNDPHNAPLLGHTEAMTEAEVIESYRALVADGGYSFMVFRDGALVADGDLRHVDPERRAAELAFLVTAVSNQGQGLGTRFATMLHAFAFAELGLERVYASVIPDNVASRRVFAKLGHVVDDGADARAYADEPSDVVSVVDRARFAAAAGPALAAIAITRR
ncbi:MAG TPA: GNAT family N-acetyltransferase [Kofleriaceae bacterium]|nr:GNAT family N-acetyltransferase [Kofleriaceae bacterium]